MSDPIRIFIGTEPKTEIPCQVLEWSIKKHCSMPVEITRMLGKEWEPIAIRQGTGFSLRRWMIPQVGCNFQGKAIYMDADQLVFGDMAELWNMDQTVPNIRATVWCTYDKDKYGKRLPGRPKVMQSSVMLIDCQKASYWTTDYMWKILSERRMSYIEFMHGKWFHRGEEEIQQITNYWNHFNDYEEGKTKLTHFTVEKTQPWYTPEHKCTGVWVEALKEAISEGAVSKEDFELGLRRFGKPDPNDHRKTHGIHPKFKNILSLFS